MTHESVCVRAYANIALVKYWGKRDHALNLPCTGSLSLTLDPLATLTEITPVDGDSDVVELNGEPAAPAVAARVSGYVDLFRSLARSEQRVRVRSRNTFPTAAGLASSASGFAALALALRDTYALDVDLPALSALARRGSGSAARSLFDGFAEMNVGERADGTDACAEPLHALDHWDLRVVVGVIQRKAKKVSSTVGMEATRTTSPYFGPWVDAVPTDLDAARDAIAERDFAALTRVAERSALRMHASSIAADPGVIYWQPATLALVHAVRAWRDEGLPVFFTIDAGPNVKVFTTPDHVDEVRARVLDADPAVSDALVCRPGRGAHRIVSLDDPRPR